MGQGTSRYLGPKEERWQGYNYNFTSNCIPMLAPMAKGGEYRILNFEMASKQVFVASVFWL
jgi:hypothetical protein